VSPLAAQPDIHDIRGPIDIPAVWPVLLVIVAAVVGAALLGLAIFWIVRRLRRGHVKTAAELAIERLERARDLAQEGRAAELAAELSDAVRVYIEARFELRAAHRTTEEFLHELLANAKSPVAAHRDTLGEFLGACDLAKFARFALGVERMKAMIDAAIVFVHATTPDKPKRDEHVTLTIPREAHS
jgi:hypothetical protein